MANKTYNFAEILKEFNKKYKNCYKINSSNSNVIIIHCSDGSFDVRFRNIYDTKTILHKNSLSTFIHYEISTTLSPKKIVDFIRSKETSKLNLKIKTLPSNKVRYAYLYTNYCVPDVGQLGRSCMRSKENQKALNFYVINNVRIVVVIDDNLKIHARALLWDNVKSTKRKSTFTYLDRVYAASEHLLHLFHDLAEENGWKSYSAECGERSYYKDDIDITNTCHFPYTDTFKILYYKDHVISAGHIPDKVKHKDVYIRLAQTGNGGYFPNLDPNRVKEAFSGNYISKKDAIKIKRYGRYVLKANIADINGAYYSVLDNKIVKTTLDGYIFKVNSVAEVFTDEKIDKNKAVHSDRYGGWIHKSNIVNIKDEIYHKSDADIICFDGKQYHISQCFVNYDRKEYNKELAKQPIYLFGESPGDKILHIMVTRKDGLIPKERAITAYDLAYNSGLNIIEYQEVYRTSKDGLVQLITGELIINSAGNKKYMKKFNNKYYIRQTFRLSDKQLDKQMVTLPDTEQTFRLPNKNQLLLFG